MFFAGVINPAKNATGVDLLPNFDFENDTDGRVNVVVLSIAAGADHGRGLSNQLCVDAADIAAAAGSDFLRTGRVGQQFEIVEYGRVAALRCNDVAELAITGSVQQL